MCVVDNILKMSLFNMCQPNKISDEVGNPFWITYLNHTYVLSVIIPQMISLLTVWSNETSNRYRVIRNSWYNGVREILWYKII